MFFFRFMINSTKIKKGKAAKKNVQGYHVQARIQAPSLQTKSTKNEGHSENMGFNGKTL